MSDRQQRLNGRGPRREPCAEHADIAALERALGASRREYLALRAPARGLAVPIAARRRAAWWPAAAAIAAAVLAMVVTVPRTPAPPRPAPALADRPSVSLSDLNATLARAGVACRTPPPMPAPTLTPPRIELPGLRAPSLRPRAVPG
jgi:hypothetical protein